MYALSILYIIKSIIGTDEDKGDLISIPNLSIVPQNNAESNNWGSKLSYSNYRKMVSSNV